MTGGIPTGPPWEWPLATLVEVGDGDGVRLRIDNGFGSSQTEWIRLVGVRAPEKDEPQDWAAAKADVSAWFREYAPDGLVKLVTYRTSMPVEIRFGRSFTRYLGKVVSIKTAVELNAWLAAKGWIDRGMAAEE